MASSGDDRDLLADRCLELAQQHLWRAAELVPFAMKLPLNGSAALVAGYSEETNTSSEIIAILKATLAEEFARGLLRGYAVAYDALLTDGRDAIFVDIVCRHLESVRFALPYRLVKNASGANEFEHAEPIIGPLS